MNLGHGGCMTHESPVKLSGQLYEVRSYGLDKDTERIDMDQVRKIAREFQPQMVVAGASAYPRRLDFESFSHNAHEVGALLMVAMAHIAVWLLSGCIPAL